ncbi:MAG: outer membrane beta-barrel protein [Bacteroidota bacterium]|nr:outer membrane beta-barrel protein [Bacteroidota bacterium]
MHFPSFVSAVALAATALAARPAAAQHQRQTRHYDHQGRPYYAGPLHITLAGGSALYDGDLGNSPANNFFGLAGSLGVLYRLTPHLHLGSELSYVPLGARDQLRERGLAFTSTNGLGTVFFRYDLLADGSVFAASNAEPPIFQVYVQGGAGLLLYDPQSYLGTAPATSTTSFFAPERNDYPALAGAFPVGAGFSVHLLDRWRAGLEANYYLTTTDQLDDISNKRLGGASASRDNFGTLMLKVDYSLE